MFAKIYTMIIDNSYDYEDDATTTTDLEVVWKWLKAGVEKVAILDAFDLSYIGYMDCEDLVAYEQMSELWKEEEGYTEW